MPGHAANPPYCRQERACSGGTKEKAIPSSDTRSVLQAGEELIRMFQQDLSSKSMLVADLNQSTATAEQRRGVKLIAPL